MTETRYVARTCSVWLEDPDLDKSISEKTGELLFESGADLRQLGFNHGFEVLHVFSAVLKNKILITVIARACRPDRKPEGLRMSE